MLQSLTLSEIHQHDFAPILLSLTRRKTPFDSLDFAHSVKQLPTDCRD